MKLPNPKHYDFIWRVENFHFFFVSIFLHRMYQKHDFLFTNKYHEWKTYLGLKDRKKLSKVGLKIFQREFATYEKKVKNACRQANKLFKNLQSQEIKNLDNYTLASYFLSIVHFCTKLWELYFYSEYFLHDIIQERLGKPYPSHSIFQKVKRMQKLKFQMRKYINHIVFQGGALNTYLQKINRKIQRRDLHFLHFQEVADILQGKNIPVKNRNIYAWGKFNGWKLITGVPALKIIQRFEKETERKNLTLELKGFPVYHGRYRGKVRIIRFNVAGKMASDISKMKKGEVLVTGSTGPEMIMACKKAGAIITEEGGICSHAAIVSRELKTPCIIGTKIATKVLRDGQMIEVDANKGVVRILK